MQIEFCLINFGFQPMKTMPLYNIYLLPQTTITDSCSVHYALISGLFTIQLQTEQ